MALYDGRAVWLVTGYPEARALLTDPRLSADRTRPGFPVLAPRFRASVARKLPLIAQDPPVHDTHRRLLNPDFSRKHMRAMRPEVQEVVDGFIDRMLAKGPPSDLVEDFATPVPSLVISRLLGVPYSADWPPRASRTAPSATRNSSRSPSSCSSRATRRPPP
ncbi:hypothetical protein ACFU5N_26595 [Streptomyces albidoflavus]